MWIGTTSPICIICASASGPCECAQPVCKCPLAPRPRYAHDAGNSARWGTFPRSPTSATLATYRRNISFALAACATKRSRSASCGRIRKAAGCATSARRKRGHTDALPAQNTNQLPSSSIAGESWKLPTTLAAKPARRASSANVASPTTAQWLQTDASALHARRWPTARSAPYATGPRQENVP